MSLSRRELFIMDGNMRQKALVDCAYSSDISNCFTPVFQEGSPYEVYERTGEIKRGLPLVQYPPVGQAFPRAKGHFIMDTRFPNQHDKC